MPEFDDERGRRSQLEELATVLMGSLETEVETASQRAPSKPPLPSGELIAGRFRVERLIGWGGMGRIHQAHDLQTQERVAIKVLDSVHGLDKSRFAREALLLAEISHPAIVRYVAHGSTLSGIPFLAMEWLDGEDLSQRLARGPLNVQEALQVLRRACTGIAAAHARGIVHRDIKPSNLFLVGGDAALVKVLDFGIAQQPLGKRALTQSGAVLGTVGYMAPEQARGERQLSPSADVFALGCVLFECLTGRAAFSGPNALAAIAKVLQEEPPAVSTYLPGAPPELDALVQRLLSKDPQARPADAAELLRALEAIDVAGASTEARVSAVSRSEQRIQSVIIATPREAEALLPEVQELVTMTQQLGFELVSTSERSLLIVAADSGSEWSQAARTASCALRLARAYPALAVAMATGNTLTTQRVPAGVAVERASAALAREPTLQPGLVALDAVTAGLLDAQFRVANEDGRPVLLGLSPQLQHRPSLLGKPAPFVGRNRELGMLMLTLQECCDEELSRAVLVTGPAGQGKSRLALEVVERVRERGDVRVLSARADPMGAGAAFVMVRQLIKQAAGCRAGTPQEQEAALREHVRSLPAADAPWLADFLCELTSLPSSVPLSAEFQAAAGNSQIMSVWLGRAFVRWLRAECEHGPLLCVLDDLQWGDLSSVNYLDEALANQDLRRCMVLALGRPEVHAAFPRLWKRAEAQEVTLGRLPPRAAATLVDLALGDGLSGRARAEIIERAAGNVFYLEELIRHVAHGPQHTLPETVLAGVQARLTSLHPEARRLLRAASVFGETFARDGLMVLVHGVEAGTPGPHEAELDDGLRRLIDQELIAPTASGTSSGALRYRFRHSLVRDAAYAMLTDGDRRRAHALAGRWLEQVGEPSAMILANHFELGAVPDKALHWLGAAAWACLEGGNLELAQRCAERGLAWAHSQGERGELLIVCAEARSMTCAWHEALALYREAAALLQPGGISWTTATAGVLLSASFLGEQAAALEALQALLTTEPQTEVSGPYGLAMFIASQALAYASQLDMASALLERAEKAAAAGPTVNLELRMWLELGSAFVELSRGHIGSAHPRLVAVREQAEALGSTIGSAFATLYLVAVLAHTGHVEAAEQARKASVRVSEALQLQLIEDYAQYFLVAARVFVDADASAGTLAALRDLCTRSDPRLVTSGRVYLGYMLARLGDLEAADRETRRALSDAIFSTERAAAYAARASVELALGRPAQALESARLGLDSAVHGAFPWTTSVLRLSLAHALEALGRHDEARAQAEDARRRLLESAAQIADPALHESFLTRISVNTETLRLAERLCPPAAH